MPKITKRVVDALKPKAAGDAFVWDSELRGFGVRVKPSGAMAFLVQYRNAHAQTRRLAIGKVGTLSPEEARTLARDHLAAVAKGADPSADRHAARTALTVTEVCDWYLKEAEAGRLLGRRGRPVKKSTLAMDRSRIEVHVKPLIGKRTAQSLTLDDIEKLQADIASGKTARARESRRGGATTGGDGVAARTIGTLQAIFAQAVRKKMLPHNPCTGVRKISGKRRKRRLTDEQISALGAAIREAAAQGENRTALAAIRALLLTGFRRMEVLGARTAWISETRTGGFVAFPDTKTGEQVRPVGKKAVEAMRAAARKNCEWAFPADRGDGHFVGVVKVLDRVCARAKLNDVSPHVLRHTFASVAGDLGFTKLTVAGLLGHAAAGDTESYVHLDTALLAAADRVSAHLAGLLDCTEAQVLTLVRAG